VPSTVSVVVAVLNAERWLAEQLAALAEQTYRGEWELLVVDNGCTDGSLAIAGAWAHRLPSLRVIPARGRRSLNHARNAGAAAAHGEYLAFCDADDVVCPEWLEALVAAAPEADILGGAFDLETLNPPLTRAWRPDEAATELVVEHGYLPYACGGNCGIWADVARAVGWDEAFDHGSSETEFCWRAQHASYTMAFVPGAVIRLRYRRRVRDLARQYYSYGRSAPLLYRRFKELGMQRDNRQALWWWRWLAKRLPDLWGSPERRGNWIRLLAFRCGRIRGSVRARVLFL
jgi:glycosyltransferase involved in cell wall biosynthesis